MGIFGFLGKKKDKAEQGPMPDPPPMPDKAPIGSETDSSTAIPRPESALDEPKGPSEDTAERTEPDPFGKIPPIESMPFPEDGHPVSGAGPGNSALPRASQGQGQSGTPDIADDISSMPDMPDFGLPPPAEPISGSQETLQDLGQEPDGKQNYVQSEARPQEEPGQDWENDLFKNLGERPDTKKQQAQDEAQPLGREAEQGGFLKLPSELRTDPLFLRGLHERKSHAAPEKKREAEDAHKPDKLADMDSIDSMEKEEPWSDIDWEDAEKKISELKSEIHQTMMDEDILKADYFSLREHLANAAMLEKKTESYLKNRRDALDKEVMRANSDDDDAKKRLLGELKKYEGERKKIQQHYDELLEKNKLIEARAAELDKKRAWLLKEAQKLESDRESYEIERREKTGKATPIDKELLRPWPAPEDTSTDRLETIFVNVDEFRDVLQTVSILKAETKIASDALNRVMELSGDSDRKREHFFDELGRVADDLVEFDRTVFRS